MDKGKKIDIGLGLFAWAVIFGPLIYVVWRFG